MVMAYFNPVCHVTCKAKYYMIHSCDTVFRFKITDELLLIPLCHRSKVIKRNKSKLPKTTLGIVFSHWFNCLWDVIMQGNLPKSSKILTGVNLPKISLIPGPLVLRSVAASTQPPSLMCYLTFIYLNMHHYGKKWKNKLAKKTEPLEISIAPCKINLELNSVTIYSCN